MLRRWGTPRDALRRWEAELGRAPAVNEVFGQHDVRSLGALVRPLMSASARASELVERALRAQPPDLLVTMLPAVHIAGHQLWDPAAVLPRGTRPPAELETALRDVYAAADAALGRIVAALPEDADVVVFSVLGMTVNSSRNDLLPGMVDAVLRGRAREDPDPGFAWRLRARIPMRLRANVASALPTGVALELTARAELRGTDWAHTRAFCVPSDTTGLVQLNLRDRERNGIVSATEAEALLDELAEGLGTFEDEDGAPVVVATERPRDTLPAGRCSDLLPDLVVHWRPAQAARTEYVTSSRFGTVRRRGAGTGRSGNHTPDAWALVVPGASRPRVAARPHAVTDLYATALAACGVAAGGEPFFE